MLEMAVDGVWMLEDTVARCRPYAVARALVEPMDTTIPVHILNPTSELVTVYASVILGTLEGVETPVELASGGTSGEGGGLGVRGVSGAGQVDYCVLLV